jgi:large subunit ribosomal protein L21
MYAIVRTGGKQYRVEEGRSVIVERLPAEEGSHVELDHVLLIADDGQVTVGTPAIEGARVVAEVEAHGRHKKIIVLKYKAKVRTRKKTGHRQHFTRLAVREILRPGQESKVAKPARRRARRQAEEAPEAPAPEAAVETPAAEAAPAAPKPRVRRAPAKPPAAEPAKRRTRKPAEATAQAPSAEAPKPRTRRRAPAAGKAEGAEEKPTPPRRRTARPKTEDKETE